MQNNLKFVFLLSCLIASGTAFADSVSDDLTKIEAQTLILKARAKQLDVQAQIVSKQNEIASKQAAAGLMERMTSLATEGDPVVLSIEGIGKRIYTTLRLNNGATVDAAPGDMLPNGMKVISIHSNEVIVKTRRRKRVRLSAGTLARSYTPAFSTGATGFPSMPPMPPRGGIR